MSDATNQGATSPWREQLLTEQHFDQFDDTALVAMAFNATDEAHLELSEAGSLTLTDDTAWNIAVNTLNANTALRVLFLRMTGGSPEEYAMQQREAAGETMQ